MQRIYFPNTQFSETLEIREKELYHQITRVLRARVWQKYIFFDGKTLQDFLYEIYEIDAKRVIFRLQETIQKSAEIFPELHLYQALPNKLEKLEYIIQKSCEVGYTSITFFSADRSQVLLISQNKKERLKKIAVEAIEQCWGNIIPDINFIENIWSQILRNESTEEIYIFCHTSYTSHKLSHISQQWYKKIHVFIGPEWWFSEKEIDYFEWYWMLWVCFWNRVLRTETVSSVVWFYLSQK